MNGWLEPIYPSAWIGLNNCVHKHLWLRCRIAHGKCEIQASNNNNEKMEPNETMWRKEISKENNYDKIYVFGNDRPSSNWVIIIRNVKIKLFSFKNFATYVVALRTHVHIYYLLPAPRISTQASLAFHFVFISIRTTCEWMTLLLMRNATFLQFDDEWQEPRKNVFFLYSGCSCRLLLLLPYGVCVCVSHFDAKLTVTSLAIRITSAEEEYFFSLSLWNHISNLFRSASY